MDTCPRCDLKRHRACICGKVKKDRFLRGATVDRHVGKRLSRLEPITIATECSGIEAPIIALRRMGINHTHVYSTECNESARVWSVYNYSPLTRYDDVTSRDPSSLPPVDIYVCGIPCQDFSMLNQQRSSENVKCESVAMSVLQGIATSLPSSFVIENVPSFRQHGLFNSIHDALSGEYDMFSNILSPHNYGSPQHRKRLYIVGIRKGFAVHKFMWPETVTLQMSCLDILSKDLTQDSLESCNVSDKYYSRKLSEWEIEKVPSIISLSTYALHPRTSTNTDISPCILASHPGLYAPHLERLLHPTELLALQGFCGVIIPPSLSNNIVRQLTGNSMSVDVLMHLFASILNCIGKTIEVAFAPVK